MGVGAESRCDACGGRGGWWPGCVRCYVCDLHHRVSTQRCHPWMTWQGRSLETSWKDIQVKKGIKSVAFILFKLYFSFSFPPLPAQGPTTFPFCSHRQQTQTIPSISGNYKRELPFLLKELIDPWLLLVQNWLVLFVPVRLESLISSFCWKLLSASFVQRALGNHQTRAAEEDKQEGGELTLLPPSIKSNKIDPNKL